MADSLVDLVMGVVDPDVVTKLAGGIGIDPTTAQNVVNSAIPGILGGIASTATTSEGAQRLSAAVGNMDMSIMDKLGAAAGTGAQASMAAEGTKLLGSLIGGAKMEAIASAVAGSNNTTPAAVKSVLGYLTPAVMGVIGQQDPANWSDGSSMMKFLGDQKGMIAAAMPAGLAAAVGGASAMAGRMGQTATSAAGNVAASMPSMPTMPKPAASTGEDSSGGMPSWVWIVLGVAILAGLAYYFTRPSAPKVAEKPAVVAEAPKPAAPAVSAPAAPAAPALDAAALGKQATAALDGVKASLASITDAASASAALPKLKDASDQLDKVTGMAAALPADAKKTLAAAVGPAATELGAQMDKVAALPGVGDIVKPMLDGLRGKLKTLLGA